MSGIYKRNGIILSNQQGSDNHQDRFFKFGTLIELHDRNWMDFVPLGQQVPEI